MGAKITDPVILENSQELQTPPFFKKDIENIAREEARDVHFKRYEHVFFGISNFYDLKVEVDEITNLYQSNNRMVEISPILGYSYAGVIQKEFYFDKKAKSVTFSRTTRDVIHSSASGSVIGSSTIKTTIYKAVVRNCKEIKIFSCEKSGTPSEFYVNIQTDGTVEFAEEEL